MDASDYTVGQYESQFHKAFVGGVTEIRTTHITTLSGKSTPDMTRDETPDSISEPTASTVEKMEERSGVVKQSDKDVSKITATITSTVTQRTSTSVVETEGKPGQIILKESKIGEPILGIETVTLTSFEIGIVVLGERYLYCLKDNCASIKYAKRLEYRPVCSRAYVIGKNNNKFE